MEEDPEGEETDTSGTMIVVVKAHKAETEEPEEPAAGHVDGVVRLPDSTLHFGCQIFG